MKCPSPSMGRVMHRIALACFAAGLSAASYAAQVELRFSHVVEENTPKGQMAIRFQELVEERLTKHIEVEVFPDGELMLDSKVLEALLQGEVELAAPSLSHFQDYTNQLQVFDLPFLFKDMDAVEDFQKSKQGKKLLSSLEEKGLIGLGYLHNGMKQLSADAPLRIPADISDKKFRIMSSDVLAAQFEAVGATPVKKPLSEVYGLLQSKTIDGQENTWSNIYSRKLYEVQPYITESNHGVLEYLVVTSAEFWNGLPEEVRDELKKAVDEAIEYGNQVAMEKAMGDRQSIISSGSTEVIELSEEEREQWVEAMKPVWQQFEEEIGADLIEAAVDSN